MKVFLAGVTGVVGRRLTPMLVEAGHQVTGLTRSADKADAVRALGAEPVVVDALNAPALRQAVEQAAPEVVIHQLTAIPKVLNPSRISEDFALTNRLRRQGTDTLLTAARQAGARRILVQSFGGYQWTGGTEPAVSEDVPRWTNVPEAARELNGALVHLERAVLGAPGIEGIVLRYGVFYGAGTGLGEGGGLLERIRTGEAPIAGGGEAVWSFVHIEDVARATLLAMERGKPGIYNIADDEPAEVRQWLPFLARVVGGPEPKRVPAWMARMAVGDAGVDLMTVVRGVVNRKAKAELDWEPVYPTWRIGFREGLAR